jgi:single-strand DNA-binding protein
MSAKILITGKLAKDPVMTYLPNGTPFTKFSIPDSETWKDKSGAKQSKTTWLNIEVWGSQAEPCNQWLSKGDIVEVEGKLVAGTDGNPVVFKRQNGEYGSSFVVRANRVQFIHTFKNSDTGSSTSDSTDNTSIAEEEFLF